jgi:hypothetical protein
MNKAKRVLSLITKHWLIATVCFCFALFISLEKVEAMQAINKIEDGGGFVSELVPPNALVGQFKRLTGIRSYGGHNYSVIKIDGVYTFCIDVDVLAEPTLKYYTIKEIDASAQVRAAYYWFINGPQDNDHYAVAQYYVWFGKLLNGASSYSYAKIDGGESYYGTVTFDEVRGLSNNLSSELIGNLYIWHSVCAPGQRFVTSSANGKRPEESDMTCSKTSTCSPTCSNNCCNTGTCDVATGTCNVASCTTPTKENNCCGQGTNNPICACDTEPKVNVANYCANEGDYEDISDLNCIKGQEQFYDTSAYTIDATTEYNNNYCRWYCVENDQTYHPGDYDYVFYAGRYFTIGETEQDSVWGPISVYGKRTCYSFYSTNNSNDTKTFTQGVNWVKFKSDISTLNTQIATAYNDFKNTWAYSKASDDSYSRQESESHSCPLPRACIKYNKKCERKDEATGNTVSCTLEGVNGCYCWDDTGSCAELEPQKYETLYPSASGFTTTSYNGGTFSGSVSKSCGSQSTYDYYSKQQYLQSLINKRQSLINAMQDCSNANTKYQLNPTITFKYNDATFKYSTSDGDIKLVTDGNTSVMYPTTKVLASTGTYDYLNCDNQQDYDSCYWETKNMDNVANGDSNPTVYYTITENTLSYHLPDSGYKEISKTEGSAFKESGDINTIQNNSGAMLPLNYKLEAGQYKISYTYGHIGNILKYSDGYFDYMINTGVNGVKAKVESGKEYITGSGDDMYEYQCEVTITNEILKSKCVQSCEDKYGRGTSGYTSCVATTCCGDLKASSADCKIGGIDVIYRTIQLQKDPNNSADDKENLTDAAVSFPSYNANGRVPGANWNKTDTYDGNPNKYISSGNVTAYITYNRNVYGNDVYKRIPLYTITLTPSLILQIREYNEKETGNSIGGYADFNSSMNCNTSGRNCLSNFIHSNVVTNQQTFSSYFDAANSSCLNLNTTNRDAQFDACRY